MDQNLLNSMKRGSKGTVSIRLVQVDEVLKVPFSLSGFTAAYNMVSG